MKSRVRLIAWLDDQRLRLLSAIEIDHPQIACVL
jgi:hypothetical protein